MLNKIILNSFCLLGQTVLACYLGVKIETKLINYLNKN